MTKDAAVAALLVALAAAMALVPAASAHGAPPVRGVDTRVLLDDDGLVGYGGCVDGTCQPAEPAGGLDVLALDVREAYLPDGSPAVVFRLIVQSEAPVAGSSLVVHVDAPAAGKDLRIDSADGLAFASASFDRLDGPFDVGDGHPKALDGWLRASALGKPGDSLSGITVASFRGDAQDDAMPGGWYANGVEVPAVPDEPDPSAVTTEDGPGSYTLSGPAVLVTASANGTADLSRGPAKVTLALVNPLTVEQFANVLLSVPAGVRAAPASASVLLQPSATRTVEVTVSNATASGVVSALVTTDLGGRAVVPISVQAPPPHPLNMTMSPSPTAPSKPTPGPGIALGGVLLLAAAAVVRRR